MFINRKRNMLNWKYVYFIEIGHKKAYTFFNNEQEKLLIVLLVCF